jgi:bidirectional [NiFe] hydrogenase diaphorase subunit
MPPDGFEGVFSEGA